MNEELRNIWLAFFNWVMGNGPRPENEVLPPEPPPALPFTQRPKDKYSRFHEPSLKDRCTDWREIHGLHLFSVLYSGVSVLTCVVIVYLLLATVAELPPLGHELSSASNEVITRYILRSSSETGSQNIVSSLLSHYRAFDSFGAAAVLFTSGVSVLMLLGLSRSPKPNAQASSRHHVFRQEDSVLRGAAKLSIPVILMLGCVVIINAHISPGGGFSGGAVISTALILAVNAFGFESVRRYLNERTFIFAVTAALFIFAVSKGCSFFMGANQIAPLISRGTAGEILSAGLTVPLNICIGIVSAYTLYGFYALFSEGEI